MSHEANDLLSVPVLLIQRERVGQKIRPTRAENGAKRGGTNSWQRHVSYLIKKSQQSHYSSCYNFAIT